MVVVGRRPRAASDGSLSDSVATGLVHLAHCPVAVIHDEDSGSLPSPHLPVLVGIDGSGGSQLGTEIAFGEASLRRVELVALHAWSDGDTSTMPTMEWPAVQSRAHQVLADGLAGWQDCYPDVTVQRIVVHNDPARHLLEKSCSAQLLVVGSHGPRRQPWHAARVGHNGRDRGSRHSGDRGPLGLRSAGTQVPRVVMTSVVDQVSFNSCTPVYAGATSDASAHHSKRKRLA